MKKLFIETYGCQMNVADSEVVASVMQMAGYEPCESLDEADAVFLNTCSVRDNAEQKIYHRLEALTAQRRKGRKIIIGVIGCMAERVKEALIEEHGVDLVAGPDAYLSLPDLIAQAETGHKAINIEPYQNGSAVIYRSQLVGFAKNEADNLCNRLKKSNKSCIVVASTNETMVLANKF